VSRVNLNRVAVRTFGQTSAAKAIRPVAFAALAGSKRMARRSPAHLSGSGVVKPGLRLSEAINLGPVKNSIWGVEQQLISPKDYSLTEHEGSKPHRITGRGKKLRFKWRKRIQHRTGFRRVRPSQFSYFDHVWHPGNRRPVKFLTTPLAAAAREHGFFYRSNRAVF
jgi:hypothetical protein